MNKVKAIIIGSLIWFLGSSFYTASYLFPFLEDVELQANLVLAVALIPNAWLGAWLYYRRGTNMPGLQAGLLMLITAIVMDAFVTVPLFIIPNGGSHTAFFGAIEFWLIALEYFLVVYSYWLFKAKPQTTAITS